MKKLLLCLTLLVISLSACKKEKNCTEERTGAVCNDNTTTNSTGSGTCSGHGGVKEWTTEKKCQ